MKKAFIVILTILLLCASMTGCGFLGKKETAPPPPEEGSFISSTAGSFGNQLARSGDNKSFPYSMFDTMPKEQTGRTNGYTYPYELSSPLRQCSGFTLNYQVVEVVKGNFSGNYHFEVLVQNLEGIWTSAGSFTMNGNSASVNVSLPKVMSVCAVAVTCSNQTEIGYSFDLSISNPY